MWPPRTREPTKEEIRSHPGISELAFRDLTIDNCLIQFSGLQSNKVLKERSKSVFKKFPAMMKDFVDQAKGLAAYPTAVGIGAFFILWMIEANLDVADENFATTLNSMFVKEKEDEVFNIVRAYYKRFKMFVHDSTELKTETRRYERQLGDQLTRVSNTLRGGDMSTKLFKVWVNGAAFHIQMLIHLVRLEGGDRQTVSRAIDGYQKELEELVDKFKKFKNTSLKMLTVAVPYSNPLAFIKDSESSKEIAVSFMLRVELLVEVLFELDEKIPLLISYFSDVQRNLDALIEMNHIFDF